MWKETVWCIPCMRFSTNCRWEDHLCVQAVLKNPRLHSFWNKWWCVLMRAKFTKGYWWLHADAKNKPGGLVSGTFGYIEFSDGGQACNDKKHSNNAYKTYAMKDCPASPPPKYDPKMPKSSSPIDANDFQGVRCYVAQSYFAHALRWSFVCRDKIELLFSCSLLKNDHRSKWRATMVLLLLARRYVVVSNW